MFSLISRIDAKMLSILLQILYLGKIKRSIMLCFPFKLNSQYSQCVKLGEKNYINSGVWFNIMDRDAVLEISDGVYIGRFVQINCMRSIYIGKNVMLADRVYIADNSHCFDKRDIPISKQGFKFGGEVVLSDGCWIGCGAVIMPGVKIGKNAVVGANAVVTKDVPDFAIVAGVPAKIIRYI